MANASSIIQKTSKRLQYLTNDLLFATGLRKAEHILAQPGQRILAYHGLDKVGNKSINGRFISATAFEKQIHFLAQNAQIVPLDDYFNQTFDHQKYTIAITFDDGYQNNLRYGLPILEKYKAAATFFVTSAAELGANWLWMDFLDVATQLGPKKIEIDGCIFQKKKWRHTLYYADKKGQKLVDCARYSPWTFIQKMETAFINAGVWSKSGSFSDYWQLLTPPEIQQLAASPCARIGAHGHTHQDLAFLSHQEACNELQQCKNALERLLGHNIQTLAYPFGTYTPELLDFAEHIGFSQQLAVNFLCAKDKNDPRMRERLCINPFISSNNQWIAVQKGKY